MRRTSRIAAVIAMALAAAPAPASAAPWLPFGDLTPRTSVVPRAEIVIAGAETTHVVYTQDGALWVRARPLRGTFGDPVRVSGAPVVEFEVARSYSRPAVVWAEQVGGEGGSNRIVSASLGAPAEQTVLATTNGPVVELAADRDDDGVDRVVWRERTADGTERIRFAEGGVTQTLAEGATLEDPVLAASVSGGGLLIAWTELRGVMVVNRARFTGTLSAPRRIGARVIGAKSLAYADLEAWLLAWTEAGRSGPRAVALRGTLDDGVRRRDVLARAFAYDVQARLGENRADYAVAWQSRSSTRSRIQVGVASRDGGRFTVTTLSGPKARTPRVATNAGAVLVAWLRTVDGNRYVEGARRSSAGRWSAVDRASEAGARELAVTPASHGSGRLHAIWTRGQPGRLERVESALNEAGHFGRVQPVAELAPAQERARLPSGFFMRHTRIVALWNVTSGQSSFWQAAVNGDGV